MKLSLKFYIFVINRYQLKYSFYTLRFYRTKSVAFIRTNNNDHEMFLYKKLSLYPFQVLITI